VNLRWSVLLVVAFAAPSSAAPRATYEEFVVVGEVLKPEITVVISRENLTKAYELRLDENFLEKIFATVQQEPF
jgi:hypothetical protein